MKKSYKKRSRKRSTKKRARRARRRTKKAGDHTDLAKAVMKRQFQKRSNRLQNTPGAIRQLQALPLDNPDADYADYLVVDRMRRQGQHVGMAAKRKAAKEAAKEANKRSQKIRKINPRPKAVKMTGSFTLGNRGGRRKRKTRRRGGGRKRIGTIIHQDGVKYIVDGDIFRRKDAEKNPIDNDGLELKLYDYNRWLEFEKTKEYKLDMKYELGGAFLNDKFIYNAEKDIQRTGGKTKTKKKRRRR